MSQAQDGFENWTARISCDNTDVPGGFAVHIFLKPPPENPMEWIGAEGYVDSYFATAVPPGAPRGHVSEGFVHLNNAIAKYSGLNSFEAKDVVPYLTNNLNWRIQKSDLIKPIPISQLPSLEVAVFSSWMSQTPGSDPTQGDVKYYPSITLGKPGGL